MKLSIQNNRIILNSICQLYILLFVYAAVSKLLDFENFQVQLGQSPLLSAFASWVAWLVPTIELILASLLLFPKWRTIALFAAFSLMIMFTTYIFIILNYSSFVPCSCGGILEKMGWTEHLIFNVFFIVLAILGLLLEKQQNYNWIGRMRPLSYSVTILFSLLFSIGVVVVLFLSSEEIMHHENPFIRRYPHHPVALTHTVDLKFNSYYFSGYANGRIYLGNYSDPLHVLSMDTTLQHRQQLKIGFNRTELPFRMVKILVRPPYFYLMDGSVPCVFRGTINNWKANQELKGCPPFTLAEPIDSTTIAFRNNNSKNGAHVLGIFNSGKLPKTRYAATFLQKQIDGIFDTDGMLQYSKSLDRMVYAYFYRNQFIVADKNGSLDYRGNTIDTVAHAKIKVAYLKGKSERKMAAPPLIVNAHSAVCNKLLFVHSKVPGRYENPKVWEQSFIIDVYDIEKNRYMFSFPIYEIGGKKLRSFFVTSTHLFVLLDTQIVVYRLKELLKKEIKSADRKNP
ncbi:hypothetical protein FNW52_16150 [Flavobacterium sp. ZT3R18]|uniref:MauE/DoxX family redox-associated membrane protein n=1 Tax=Flavobacterium sp. ZT3R18 TaxID=2594429 RepID=UPI00117AAC24|nr:MauE/DoxX family redox-associated membrane protein [Flavobacterium sp. ZT3R18]TRX32987.1 hypothetical protein FNW52_16150 [Flavobacterium sp. ZT3R18]